MDYNNILHEFETKFPNINIQKIKEFLLNIILVLTEVRLGYLESLSFQHPHTFTEIINCLLIFTNNKLYFQKSNGGFLISLIKNNIHIKNILNNDNIHTALAIILKYPSVGYEWNNQFIDRYRIGITVDDNELFAFFCPVKKFTYKIKDHIHNLLHKSNYIFKDYNLLTVATYQLWPGNKNRKFYWINEPSYNN